MSWFPVAHWLEQAGIKVIRVKGQRVRALRRYLSEHTKTDAADAYVLGAIPLFGGVPADPVYVPDAERHALQRLTRQRERLEDEASAIKRRLLDLVRWACPALEAALPDLRTNLSLAVLRELLDPARVLKMRRSALLRFVAKHASGNHPHSGPFAETLVDGLKATASETRLLHGGTIDFTRLQVEVAIEIDRMRLIEQHLSELRREIEVLYGKLHPSDALRTIPGIGDALAPLVLGVLHEARRFTGLHQLRGFCGMFPRTNSSGGADQPGQAVTQSGNNRIKRALYLAADAARRIDPGLAEVYWRRWSARATTTSRPSAPWRHAWSTGSARCCAPVRPMSCATPPAHRSASPRGEPSWRNGSASRQRSATPGVGTAWKASPEAKIGLGNR